MTKEQILKNISINTNWGSEPEFLENQESLKQGLAKRLAEILNHNALDGFQEAVVNITSTEEFATFVILIKTVSDKCLAAPAHKTYWKLLKKTLEDTVRSWLDLNALCFCFVNLESEEQGHFGNSHSYRNTFIITANELF